MKRLFERMRRIAVAALSAALLWGVLLPATPVRAEDAPAPQAVNDAGQELILLHKHETGQDDMPYVTDTLRDGDTIPALKLSFGEITLCRGDAHHPLTQSETTVQLYLGDTLVPEDAVKFVPLHDTYAQYGVQVNTSGVLTQLLAQASPDFGMTLKLTAGEESLSITIPNAGVTVEGPTNLPLTIQAAGPDLYAASVYLNVTSDALRYIQPNMDWIAADMQLTGSIAEYFTDPRTSEGYGLVFTPTEKLAELAAHQPVSGQLTWTGKLDSQPHSLEISYINAGWWGSWYSWSGTGSEYWMPDTGVQLEAGQSGSFLLRLYPQNTNPSSGAQPIRLDEQYLQKNLPAGITATLQEDGVTLRVDYALTSADVNPADTSWTLTANLPGMAGPAVVNLQVKAAPAYWLASFSMNPSLPPYSYQYTSMTSLNIATLYEGYALIPLIDGRPAATREELEQSGITVADSADPYLIQATPRLLNFTDSSGKTSQVWGLCLAALAENAVSESRTLTVSRNGESVGTVAYTLDGMNNNGNRTTPLQSDALKTFELSGQAQPGTIYAVKDNNGQALPLTAAPVVTGAAAQNLTVVWKEGLSGVRVDLNAEQVPGEATVEIRVGDTVRRIVYTFIRYPASATYYSKGLDGSRRNYNETLQFTGDLAGVSGRNPQPVQTARFTEDGSFDVYLYSMQYIAQEQYADPTQMDRYYSFAAELVENIQFYTSDPEVLRIEKQITHSDETDGAFPGNGYANLEGNCFGVTLTPGGKSGSCDVYAVIQLKRPSDNDPFGCDTSKTPEMVTIGHTFTVQSREETETYTANPDTLPSVLESITMTSTPVLVLLESGEYPMDLNLSGKNLILRSADPENPARFTGDPDAEGGFIIQVNAPSASFALEDLVVDGGGKRGGVQQLGDSMQGIRIPFTIRRCQIQNCTTGVSGMLMGGLRLENTLVDNCATGVDGAQLYYCTLQNNGIALAQQYQVNITQDFTARWSRFTGNTTDVAILTTVMGDAAYTVNLPQNYWNGNPAPILKVLKLDDPDTELEGKTVHLYASPYYADAALTTLNVDVSTTQVEDGTLLLPVEKSETGEGGMKMSAEAFAAIQEADMPAQFPILDTESREMARWSFDKIQNTTIDTELNVEDELSDQAQAAVDKLPQSEQNKILQEVNLSHNGQLPGRATLSIKASQLPSGGVEQLYLYWVKADGSIVPAEVIDVTYDAATRCYVITIDHCSEYVITSGKLETTGGGGSATPEPTPGSGDDGSGTAPTATPTAVPSPTPHASAENRPEASSQPTQSELFSAQQVIDAFKAQPDSVRLDVTAQDKVSQKAFELLANRPDAELRLEGEGFAWVFRGSELVSTELPGGAFAAGVTLGVDNETADRIAKIAAGAPWYGFETEYSGQLPGPAQLELVVNTSAFIGMQCGLYWLPETGDAERIATVTVGEDGRVSLPLEHCSLYFLVAEEPAEPSASHIPAPDTSTPAPEEAADEPASGFPVIPVAGGGVLLAAVLAVILWFRRR